MYLVEKSVLLLVHLIHSPREVCGSGFRIHGDYAALSLPLTLQIAPMVLSVAG